MSLGKQLLDLVDEGIQLRTKMREEDDRAPRYRNPLWYDEAKGRLEEIEGELDKLLEQPVYSISSLLSNH